MRLLSCIMLATAALTSAAKDFPFEFKTLKPEEIRSFPGAFRTYGRLQVARPQSIRKEPAPACRQPFYGELNAKTDNVFAFRVEESKDGNGYDRLLLDLNQNGDLTDDPVLEGKLEPRTNPPPQMEFTTFWPIPVATNKLIGSWRPVYRGTLRIETRDLSKGTNVYIGVLMISPAWYLETTVELDGFKQKVGVIDSMAQMRLGNAWKPDISGSGRSWIFNLGDSLLQDKDESGSFEQRVGGDAVSPFGPFQYFGTNLCEVSLVRGNQFLRVEPWTGPLAEVTVQPRGQQVLDLKLAWERAKGQWQLMSVEVTNGTFRVPPGNYRYYGCTIMATATGKEPVLASGWKTAISKTMTFRERGPHTLRCGAPLQIQASAELRKPEKWVMERQGTTNMNSRVDSEFVLAISGQIKGANEETYQFFYTGEGFKQEADQPTFTIVDDSGQTVGSGNLEFG